MTLEAEIIGHVKTLRLPAGGHDDDRAGYDASQLRELKFLKSNRSQGVGLARLERRCPCASQDRLVRFCGGLASTLTRLRGESRRMRDGLHLIAERESTR